MNRRYLGPIVATATLLVGAACGTDSESAAPDYGSQPELSVEGKSVYHYDNLSEMAADSAYVFRGTVVSASPGRTVGESKDDQLTYRTVVVRVLETVQGPATPGQELEFEEEGYETDGTGYVMNGVQWSTPGDEAWYFLREAGGGYLRLASQHGRFNLAGKSLGPSGLEPKDIGPWSGITAHNVAVQVRDAVTGAQK